MTFNFEETDIKQISTTLGIEPEKFINTYIWKLTSANTQKPLVLTLHLDTQLGKETKGSIVTVQTQHGYYELHHITGYLFFEPDEIIFINSNTDFISCLIIGQQCTCSLFSNIRRELLNADFSELDPAVLLSAMQLSVTESLLND